MRREAQRTFLMMLLISSLTAVGMNYTAARSEKQPEVSKSAERAIGRGVIKGINSADRQVQITHEAIPELKWPGMTMAFKVGPGVNLEGLTPGAKVLFTLSKSTQGGYVIDKIQRAE